MGAGVIASRLRFLPRFILKFLDKLLSLLFHALNWNKLLLFLFQLDKAVLLAIVLRENAKDNVTG